MDDTPGQKAHNKPHSGRKAEKKRKKHDTDDPSANERRNPKAFAIQNVRKAERTFRRSQDVTTKKHHTPLVDRTPLEPPPLVIAIVGPPKVGKSTLMQCLIKNFTRERLREISGPVTVVSGKKRRLTFIECNNDLNSMIDIAKVADVVLLLIDASFGFEMETFEFLNISQAHGFPRIMGVLTHLDIFKNPKKMRNTKKMLKHRFWTEIYQGAKLFYLSGMIHGEYLKNEIHNLGRFISVMKMRPILWRTTHPYLLVDRVEDLTDAETIRLDERCDRKISLYGYCRGMPLKRQSLVHIAGVGDYLVSDITHLPDPCPTPVKPNSDKPIRRRKLNEKERLLYAPMSGVGGIVYDKDAVYIELGGSHSHNDQQSTGFDMDKDKPAPLDSQLQESGLKVFNTDKPILGTRDPPLDETRQRRKVKFLDECDGKSDSEDSEDASDEEADEDDNDCDDENHIKIGNDETDSSEKIHFDSDEEDDSPNEWRYEVAKKLANSMHLSENRAVSIQKFVYEESSALLGYEKAQQTKELASGLFRTYETRQESKEMENTLNSIELTTFPRSASHDWSDIEALDSIRDCFVTGRWSASQDASRLLETDDKSDDDDVYGDFVDLENKTADGNDKDADNESMDDSDAENNANEMTDEEERKAKMEKKKRLKEEFNMDYDSGKDPEKSFFELEKERTQEVSERNKAEFEGLSEEARANYEGFRAGLYLRLEFHEVPHEFVTHLNTSRPIVIGGLLHGESSLGYNHVRIKKHRWYKRILKTRDPLIISLGWRRFQTVPLYYMKDHNERNRLLKYTPEHLHCQAAFWGPLTPQTTGFVAIQRLSNSSEENFRIAATGVVLDLDKSTQIVKKLKLIGDPIRIDKKTAFIRGMFHSSLEVTKFEGASIRTVSGIRGQIKKAIRAPLGAFRATFEDKIVKSDIVFLRAWVPVPVPQLYAPVTSLLLSASPETEQWVGMKSTGQLRFERGLPAPQQSEDSRTVPAAEARRKQYQFKPNIVPNHIQRQLPFAAKPKFQAQKANKVERVAVIRQPEESRTLKVMKMIHAMDKDKKRKDRIARTAKQGAYWAKKQQLEQVFERKDRERKKNAMRKLSKAEGKFNKGRH